MKTLIMLLSLASVVSAQPSPEFLWIQTLRSAQTSSSVTAVRDNADGELFMCGYFTSGQWSGSDMVMKLSAEGDSLWSYSLGESYEWAGGLIPTVDGGCLLGGSHFADPQSVNMSLTRLNSDGSLAWRTLVEGDHPAWLVRVLSAPDGYFVVGNISDSLWMADRIAVARVDLNGAVQWWQEIDMGGVDEIVEEAFVIPGGLMICGEVTNNMGFIAGAAVHKVLADGTVLWNRRVYQWEREQGVLGAGLLPDGGMAILMIDVTNLNLTYQHQIYHVDAEGHVVGFERVATPSDHAPVIYIYTSMVTVDDYCMLTGLRRTEDDPTIPDEICLVKLDLGGDTLWTQLYDVDDRITTAVLSVRLLQMQDGAYLLAGSGWRIVEPNPNIVVIKTGWDGAVGVLRGQVFDEDTQQPLVGATVETSDGARSVVTDQNGNYIMSLAGGLYQVEIRAQGYCDLILSDVEIEVHAETVRDAGLAGLHAAVDVTSINLIWAGTETGSSFQLIHNGGPCAFEFTALETESWLAVEPEAGVVEVGAAQQIEVRTVGWLPNPPVEYHTTLQVRAVALDSLFEIPVSVFVTVSADEPAAVPARAGFTSIYPNPFNAQATISFSVSAEDWVTLKIYDVVGQEVARLAEGRFAAGDYRREFSGGGLSSGIYMAELTLGDRRELRKLVLLR